MDLGRIPPIRRADYCHLNTAITDALNKTGLEGPLRYAELWSLIKGASALYIQVQNVMFRNAQGVEENRRHYYAQLVPVPNTPQVIPESTVNPLGISVQLIIDQLKRFRSCIITNQKNEKCAYDIIYDRIDKAIKDLRVENNFPF